LDDILLLLHTHKKKTKKRRTDQNRLFLIIKKSVRFVGVSEWWQKKEFDVL